MPNRHTGLWAASNPGGVFEEYRCDAFGRRVLVRSRSTGPGARWWPPSCATECLKSYVERTVWDGDQILYEVRALAADSVAASTMEDDYATSTTVQEDRFGRVGYTHALGIDRPVLMARMGLASGPNLILALHTDWQEQFASGTYMNGSACVSPSCPVDWPAARTTVDGDRAGVPASVAWQGNLITQKTDGGGLQYMRNRYYDPKTGRITQEDPIGLAGGLNVYGFAGGDPVNFSDPLGLSPQCDPPGSCLKDWVVRGTAAGASAGTAAAAACVAATGGACALGPAEGMLVGGTLSGFAAGFAVGAVEEGLSLLAKKGLSWWDKVRLRI